MRKLLTAGIFGTILSLTGVFTADASIISRGFFDEAMENYATNTALDLKANQTDLTALSNKIGIYRWNTGNVNLEYNAFPFTVELFPEFRRSSESWAGEGSDELPITYYMEANNANIYVPGLAGVTNKLLNGWTNSDNLTRAGIIALNNGWTDSAGETYQGIKALNEGWTSQSGIIINPGIKAMFDGWTAGGNNFPGLYSLSKDETLLQYAYNSNSSAYVLMNGAKATTIDGVDYTGPVYPLWKLSEGIDKIGTLPSGNLPTFPGAEFLFPWLKQSLTYPTSLAELITAIYGNLETRQSGLLEGIITGFRFDSDGDGSTDDYIGLLPNYNLAKRANDQIGTLPTQISGNDTTWARYGFETPIELPTTVGGMFDMLFHDERNSREKRFSLSAIMASILTGSYRDDGSAVFYGLYDLTDALELGSNRDNYPLVTAVKANTAAIEKIGTLPAGYDNVGAALTAMKSDIDAKNLPSTSDDGQYVLTAKKVGETITYTWVKMDLTTEEQGQ